MEELANRKTYPTELATDIEALGAMAISIANRWLMGWPERVTALLQSGAYLEHLAHQVEQEKTVLANESGLRHLARREIFQMYELRESPPC